MHFWEGGAGGKGKKKTKEKKERERERERDGSLLKCLSQAGSQDPGAQSESSMQVPGILKKSFLKRNYHEIMASTSLRDGQV